MIKTMFSCKHLVTKKFDLHRIRPELQRCKVKVQNMTSIRSETFLHLAAALGKHTNLVSLGAQKAM